MLKGLRNRPRPRTPKPLGLRGLGDSILSAVSCGLMHACARLSRTTMAESGSTLHQKSFKVATLLRAFFNVLLLVR